MPSLFWFCLLDSVCEVVLEAIKDVLDALSHRAPVFWRTHVKILIAQARQFTDVASEFLISLSNEMRNMKMGIILSQGTTSAYKITLMSPEMPDPHPQDLGDCVPVGRNMVKRLI